MDIEKLIRKGKNFSRKRESIEDELIQDLTTALSTLQAENVEMQKQLNEFSEFLCHTTGGLLSKTNYTAPEMITTAEYYQQKRCDECDLRAENMRWSQVASEQDKAIERLQEENEKLKNAADSWKKKWAGLDKAVRNGSVYRPMQEELNLTHEENQSLKDENEKLRADVVRLNDLLASYQNVLVPELRSELEQVKKCIEIVEFQRDAAIKDLSKLIGDIEETRCKYRIDNVDADNAFADLCGGYCANVDNFCYDKDEYYRCKRFEWRGPQKENA